MSERRTMSNTPPLPLGESPVPTWQPILLALCPLDPIGFVVFRQKSVLYNYCATKTVLYGASTVFITLITSLFSQQQPMGGPWTHAEFELVRMMRSYMIMVSVMVSMWMFAIYGALTLTFDRQIKADMLAIRLD